MIRLLIADEQKCVQAQILEWLATENGIVIVDTANNGKIALEKVEQLRPDVVIMDLLMPVMDGVSATQIIHQRYPEIKILVFSSSDRSDNLKQALAAGAKGYVLKDTTKEDLLFALYAVTRGSVYLGPKVWQEDKIFSSPLPQTKLHLERWTMWLAKEVICWWRTRSEQEPVAVNNILTVLQLEDNLEPNQIIRLLEQPPEEESLLELLKLRLEELKNRCQKRSSIPLNDKLQQVLDLLAEWFAADAEDNSDTGCMSRLQARAQKLRFETIGQFQRCLTDCLQKSAPQPLFDSLQNLELSLFELHQNYRRKHQQHISREYSAWRAYYNLKAKKIRVRLFWRDGE